MTTRRFPPPWRADKIPGGYVVRDANGQALTCIYSRNSGAEALQANVLTKDEARRINVVAMFVMSASGARESTRCRRREAPADTRIICPPIGERHGSFSRAISMPSASSPRVRGRARFLLGDEERSFCSGRVPGGRLRRLLGTEMALAQRKAGRQRGVPTLEIDSQARPHCDVGVRGRNDNIVFSEQIDLTDFPVDEIRFYCANKTILLPSKH
jgi:hypothetical protein